MRLATICSPHGGMFPIRSTAPSPNASGNGAGAGSGRSSRRIRTTEKNPDYWRRYRRAHPGYTERNREQQHQRNRKRGQADTGPSPPGIAKMDAYEAQTAVASGTYRLIPVSGRDLAKMDAYLVEMHVLSRGYGNMEDDCKERTR